MSDFANDLLCLVRKTEPNLIAGLRGDAPIAACLAWEKKSDAFARHEFSQTGRELGRLKFKHALLAARKERA